jgi:hypothetical protein
MATQGTALLDFGAFPGASDASVAVTGQSSIAGSSLVEAWLFPAATDDHSADEHLVETLRVLAGNVVAGVGFTIIGALGSPQNAAQWPTAGGIGTLIYGKWNVAWVWN